MKQWLAGDADRLSHSAAHQHIQNGSRFAWRFPLTDAIRHGLSEVVPFDVDSAHDWRAVHQHHVNVLLEGRGTAIEPVVRGLLPHLRQPVASMRSGPALSLPTVKIATLILDKVDTLTMQEQTQLLEWLNAASSRPQLISTSPQPLFPRVERGLFKDALYYRLNVIRMKIVSSTIGPLPPLRPAHPG
jgi:hypothetical protein